MNCYDCSQTGVTSAAIAICHVCGAAVCPDHANLETLALTVVRATSTRSPVKPPLRRIRCHTCAAAIEAAGEMSIDRTARL